MLIYQEYGDSSGINRCGRAKIGKDRKAFVFKQKSSQASSGKVQLFTNKNVRNGIAIIWLSPIGNTVYILPKIYLQLLLEVLRYRRTFV